MKTIRCTKGVPITPKLPIKIRENSSFKTYSDFIEDCQLLAGNVLKEIPDIAGVIGVPRSGMIPASLLAITAGVPLYSFSEKKLIQLDSGRKLEGIKSPSNRPYILIEDSVNQGTSLRSHLKLLKERVKTGAVYVNPLHSNLVDFFAVSLPMPHYFAWHLFGAKLQESMNLGYDLDGVICFDPTPEEWIEPSPIYDHFVENAKPLYLPVPQTVRIIVTARLERYRSPTEAWLAKYAVKYQKLVMGPWQCPTERSGANVGAWKASVLAQEAIGNFIESNRDQATTIAKLLKINVMCSSTGEIF